MTESPREVQRRIGQELGVLSDFDPAHEVDRRSQFLADLLAANGLRTLVVGISGGVDSATVGMLCRRAVRRRPLGSAALVAVRLPRTESLEALCVMACLATLTRKLCSWS